MNWLHEIPLSDKAAEVRRGLGVIEFNAIQRSVEHLSLVTSKPIPEMAERLLCSIAATMVEDEPILGDFLTMIEEIIEENEGRRE